MLSDTSPEARRVYFESLALLSPAERVQIALELTEAAEQMQRAAILRRNPEATEAEVVYELVRIRYGKELADRVYRR